MRSHRLDRLAKLTQGVALVGLGLTEAACGGEPRVNSAPKGPGVNIVEMGDAGAPTSDAPAPSGAPATADVGPGKPVHMNAPSSTGSATPIASATPAASGSTAAKPTAPPSAPTSPAHVNTVKPSPKK